MSETNSGEQPGHILIVDDDPANLRLLRVILAGQGYTVYPAGEGELALNLAQSTLPDLILLDIMMPGMDGYQVCEHLKANERTRNIPIIFITALTETRDKVKAFQLGAVDYLTKPLQREEVLARVKTHLTLYTMQKQLEAQNAQLQQEITERKQAEQALRQAQAELERRVKERTAALTRANTRLQAEIAERKQAEQARQEGEERYRTLVELSPEAIAVHSKGRIVYINQAGVELLGGVGPEELLGRPVLDFVHPDYKEIVKERVRKSYEQREPAEPIEEKFIRLDGQVIEVEVTAAPITYLGEPATLLVIGDITERKQVEEERERLIRKLEDALAQVKTLSGLLPICASCKKIRDDQGQWRPVEAYVRDHSEAEFSHSICPDCMRKLYPEFVNDRE